MIWVRYFRRSIINSAHTENTSCEPAFTELHTLGSTVCLSYGGTQHKSSLWTALIIVPALRTCLSTLDLTRQSCEAVSSLWGPLKNSTDWSKNQKELILSVRPFIHSTDIHWTLSMCRAGMVLGPSQNEVLALRAWPLHPVLDQTSHLHLQ